MPIENPFAKFLEESAATADSSKENAIEESKTQFIDDSLFGESAVALATDDEDDRDKPAVDEAPAPKKTRQPRKQKAYLKADSVADEDTVDVFDDAVLMEADLEIKAVAWSKYVSIIEESQTKADGLRSNVSGLVDELNSNRRALDAEISALEAKLKNKLAQRDDMDSSESEEVARIEKMKSDADAHTTRVSKAKKLREAVEKEILTAIDNKSGTYGAVRVTVIGGVPHIEKV